MNRKIASVPLGDIELVVSQNLDVSFQLDDDTKIRISQPSYKIDCGYTVWLYYHGCEYRYLTNNFDDWVEHIELVVEDQAQFADKAELRRTPESVME